MNPAAIPIRNGKTRPGVPEPRKPGTLPPLPFSRSRLAAGFALRPAPTAHAQTRELPNTGLANPGSLIRLYGQWRTKANASALNIPLVSFGGLASEDFDASGRVAIDLVRRTVSSVVSG